MRRIAIAAAVLTLAGCGSSGPAKTASTAPKTPPADGGSYASTQAVLDRLGAAGIACTSQQPVANPSAAGTLSMTDCTSPSGAAGGSDGDTVVVVFDTHDHAQAYASGIISFAQGLGGEAPFEIVGVNWAINTVSGYGPQVLGALGGAHAQS